MYEWLWTNLATYFLIIGVILVIAGIVLMAWMHKTVKAIAAGLVTFAVGALLVLVAFGTAPTSLAGPAPVNNVPGTSAIATFSTTGYWTGQTAAMTYLASSHTINLDFGYNKTASAFEVYTSAAHTVTAAYEVFWLNFTYSRSDAINQTAGFYSQITGIPTVVPTSSSTAYSPIGYTAATSTSGGVWSINYDATYGGSFSGTQPNVNAPTVTSTQLDLTGVAPFGSAKLSMKFTMAGNGGTSGLAYSALTQYASYPFNVVFTGGQGVTPTQYTVNLVYLGSA
jgi:hypothetical protein